MRILFATDHIHLPQGGGGAERNTHELSIVLQEQGHTPAVLSSFASDGSWLSWSARLRRVLPPACEFPRDRVCGYPVFRGWNMDRVGEVVDRFRPDVVVAQSANPAKLLHILDQFGVPLANYVHEVLNPAYMRAVVDAGMGVIANSQFTAGRFRKLFGVECPVVLPLVDPRYYGTGTKRQRILFVNTVPRKGVETAFALAERRPDIPFDFVVSWILKPAQRAELEARAHKAGNIQLHPPTNDMRPLYARARLVLIPSLCEESWGRVATEAHISGIPVLGSDLGGLPQAIGPGGMTVAADAPIETWLAALSRLWDDPKTYEEFSEAARSYSGRPEIQPAAIAASLQRALSEIISSDRPPGKAPRHGNPP